MEIYGANENAAGAGDPFFREAVSAHRPVFLESARRLPPSPLPSNATSWKMNPRDAGTGGHTCLRDPPLLSES